MVRRLELDSRLRAVAAEFGAMVYFQPPDNLRMQYPCIRYERSGIAARHADGIPYTLTPKYTLTCITTDPDSELPMRLASLSGCSYDRRYVADNLYHDVLTIYS